MAGHSGLAGSVTLGMSNNRGSASIRIITTDFKFCAVVGAGSGVDERRTTG